ncbi:MAG: hypothetical protein Q7J67_00915 [bacterium]|nr:hypothetical protein [bacterium]
MEKTNIKTLSAFDKCFRKLHPDIKNIVLNKLDIFIKNPNHPSLRIKKIKGTDNIWEMSITKNYRITFTPVGNTKILRKVGTHNILSKQ